MGKSVYFVTPKAISELDITTIGGSDKRHNKEQIGQFCSGLKYALALFIRHNVECHIISSTDGVETEYEFNKTIISDDKTKKQKEVLNIIKTSEVGSKTDIPTAFSVELGYDWKLEYALREIWSNMVDEKGYYTENVPTNLFKSDYTIFKLYFEEGSEFDEVWKKRDTLFIEDTEEPLFVFSSYDDIVKVYANKDEIGRVYKQGILVYEEEQYPSYIKTKQKNSYRFSTNFGNLDERRVIGDKNSFIYRIFHIINNSGNVKGIIDLFLKNEADDFSILSQTYSNSLTPSQEIIDYVRENPNVNIPYFYRENLERLENTPLTNRRITTLQTDIYSLKKEVKVTETVKEIEEKPQERSIEELITKRVGFKIEYPIKKAYIRGAKTVSDMYNKTILISDDFDYKNDEDIIDFIIQHFNLVDNGEGNTFRKIIKLLIK